jgi:hypothetical protein
VSKSASAIRLKRDHSDQEEAMKYMMLIYQGTTPTPRDAEWEGLSDEVKNGVYADYKAINENPRVTSGEQMQAPEMASTVVVKDGETLVTDGPFAETKDAIGGYFFLEAENLDEAIELATRVPAARMGGAIEIRPLGG